MDVRDLQQRLASLGYYTGRIDGLHGPRTIAAIEALQKHCGLRPDGVVGAATLTALGVVAGSSALAPKTSSPACEQTVRAWEGLEDGDPSTVLLEPYICPAGVATVGWGHAVLDASGRMIRVGVGVSRAQALAAAGAALKALFAAPAITREQAISLLSVDLRRFERTVALACAQGRFRTAQPEFDAMVSFAFNVGEASFEASSVRRLHVAGSRIASGSKLDIGRLKTASQAGSTDGLAQAFCAWAKADGKWSLGLFRRRLCEALIYRGDAPPAAIAAAQAAH